MEPTESTKGTPSQNELLALEAGERWLIEHNAAKMLDAWTASQASSIDLCNTIQVMGSDGFKDFKNKPAVPPNQSPESWRLVCDVVTIPGCGSGVVATRRLAAGTILATETPLLVAMNGPDEMTATIEAFRQLSADQSRDYLDLAVTEKAFDQARTSFLESHGFPIDDLGPDAALIYGIRSTNGWGSKDRAFVFKLGSRFNHRCIYPNVEVIYDNDGLAEYRVIDDVEIGDELTVTYIGSEVLLPRPERKLELAAWDFDCCCLGCTDSPFTQRQEKFRSFRRQLHEMSKRNNRRSTSYRASRILFEGYEVEHLFHTHYMASAYNLAEYELTHGRPEAALEWLTRCARNVLIGCGSNGRYRELSEVLALLQAVIRNEEPLHEDGKLMWTLRTLSQIANVSACEF